MPENKNVYRTVKTRAYYWSGIDIDKHQKRNYTTTDFATRMNCGTPSSKCEKEIIDNCFNCLRPYFMW